LKANYTHFTQLQKENANATDLVSFLQMRGETLERVGREHKLIYNDSFGKHDSITIRGSTWFDHKNQEGGGAIKFMQYFYNLDFPNAVNKLLDVKCSEKLQSSAKIVPRNVEHHKEFKLPEANAEMHRVFAYLIKQRFIDPEIISHFAHEKTLYEEKEYHNVVFVGTDEKGIPRQAHKRSTTSFGKSFRQTIDGSDTRYSFSHIGMSEKLFVFEAPIDMLSYLTLHKENWQENSNIALNGVYENAMLQFLKDNKNLQAVILCVDNDEGGVEATDRLKDILIDNGYIDISSDYSKNKDWNEDLKEMNGQPALPAVSHKRKTEYFNQTALLRHFPCKPEKLSSQIYATFKNQQNLYLAEYALAGSAFFICQANKLLKHSEADIFKSLKINLIQKYKPYTDKARTAAKYDNMKMLVLECMKDFKDNPARSVQQMQAISDKLVLLADCALRVNVEHVLDKHKSIFDQTQELPKIRNVPFEGHWLQY